MGKIYQVVVIQLQSDIYFWAIVKNGKMIARSCLIDKKPLIEIEAEEISNRLGLEGTIFIQERERKREHEEIIKSIKESLRKRS